MSSLWNSSSAESGILRKNDTKDKLEDLLVFGYACKLFRDDHKALEIDQGKHLIPWMGENSLKIDRYDGRGALSDLKPFEASKEGYDATRWLGLSESERKIEQLCDEERYFALHTNEEEDELYKEEELKRLQTNQIHYNYDEKSDGKSEEQKTEPPQPAEEDDEPFVPAPGLDVPVNMVLPKTMKQNARIEKTASFISKQGPQMEILLKTKQSGNPQFSFLNQDDPLYRYYRHILMAIKTGRYQIQEEQVKNEESEKQEEDHYLHPSLAPVGLQSVHSAPIIPQINYKPSANCAYSQLINKIKGNQPVAVDQAAIVPPPPPATAPAAAATADQFYQLQFYQQYGYWPQVDQAHAYYQQTQATPPLPAAANQQQQQYIQYTGATAIYPKETGANPYAQIVSNVSKTKTEDDVEPVKTDAAPETITPAVVQQPPSLFSLAQYSGSESDEDDVAEEEEGGGAQAVVIPPADVQVIVDKMASYVAKNGVDFENIVKAKGDPRFVFLEAKHLYNPYYKTKLREYQGDDNKTNAKTKEEAVSPVDEQMKEEKTTEKKSIKSKEKKIITPVSFSIKKHSIEVQQVPRDKSALPIEDSTDDEEKEQPEVPPPANPDDQAAIQADNPPATTAITATATTPTTETDETPKPPAVIEIEDPIMELIDLTEDLEEKRDRRAEDRVKDKLALAAREKLAAKNRALQLERKKRAAAFLSQLKPQSSSNPAKQENDEDGRLVNPADADGDQTPVINEEYSRLVYHIENEKVGQNEAPRTVEKRPRSRSRSRSRNTHKSSRHQRKSHKRSHSHSRKRKREKRSHERKKSKRRHRSRSRSSSKHRKVDKKDVLTDIENKNRKTTEQYSVSSSEYESDDYPTNTTSSK